MKRTIYFLLIVAASVDGMVGNDRGAIRCMCAIRRIETSFAV
jgi:hypothetical protein